MPTLERMAKIIPSVFSHLKLNGCNWLIIRHFSQGSQLMWLPVCFPVHQSPAANGFSLKGKNLLPGGRGSKLFLLPGGGGGANSFLLVNLFLRTQKNIDRVVFLEIVVIPFKQNRYANNKPWYKIWGSFRNIFTVYRRDRSNTVNHDLCQLKSCIMFCFFVWTFMHIPLGFISSYFKKAVHVFVSSI